MQRTETNPSTFVTGTAAIVRPLAIVILALTLTLVSIAQVERATITGAITDRNGAIVPGATVRITNEGTNETANLQTDTAGQYTASNLNPGSYTIEIEKSGFSKHINKGFVVQVGQTARLDVVMDVGSVTQSVEVTGAIPVLQAENASVGQVIATTAVRATSPERKKSDPVGGDRARRYRSELCADRHHRFGYTAGRVAAWWHDHRGQRCSR